MRLEPDQRRSVIITAALRVARDSGLVHVNHSTVSARCVTYTSPKTVKHYFRSRNDLWRAVLDADDTFEGQARELGL